MILIDYKITSFYLYLFACELAHIALHTQILTSRKLFCQYASYLPIFSPLHTAFNGKYHAKHLYTQLW